jgi:hypothetical protein
MAGEDRGLQRHLVGYAVTELANNVEPEMVVRSIMAGAQRSD